MERKTDDNPGFTANGQSRGGEEGARLAPERNRATWVSWQSALYVFVLLLACVFLVPLTSLWWMVPVLGAVVPLALAALGGSESVTGKLHARKTKERELLEALAERGDLTPTMAAMRTSLTVDEAAKMLDGLAAKGHLRVRKEGGTAAYALPEQGAAAPTDAALDTPRARRELDAPPVRQPDDPLSERELEVLALLASGRTNAEISRDLYVALGTVKSHVNNIYRKLGARNRAEAVTRARELNLLR